MSSTSSCAQDDGRHSRHPLVTARGDKSHHVPEQRHAHPVWVLKHEKTYSQSFVRSFAATAVPNVSGIPDAADKPLTTEERELNHKLLTSLQGAEDTITDGAEDMLDITAQGEPHEIEAQAVTEAAAEIDAGVSTDKPLVHSLEDANDELYRGYEDAQIEADRAVEDKQEEGDQEASEDQREAESEGAESAEQ